MPHNACATLAADAYVLALVCVMNSVVVPWLVWALLARRLEAAASMSTSTQRGKAEGPLSTRGVRTRRRPAVPPLTMHAAVCSALRRRLSRSDSALLGNAEGPLSNAGTERGVRTSPSTPTMRPLMPPRTSPVFARMLANTREAPATPRRSYLSQGSI
jgi:hypothetical protein